MVGCDIVKVDRFEDIKNLDGFLNKYFALSEIDYIKSKNYSTQTIAGLYACKEAVLKAFGIGIGRELALNKVEISHNDFGAPQIVMSNSVEFFLKKLHKKSIFVSISHDGDYAMAVCQIL